MLTREINGAFGTCKLKSNCECAMDSEEPCSNWQPKTKDAYMWVGAIHPYVTGYPGVSNELFFSSPETFKQLLGRPMSEYEALVKVWVPIDFDDWDYIPNDY